MKHANKCVCQICSCGAHKCPKTSHVPFSGNSDYKATYVPHSIPDKFVLPKQSPQPTHYDPSLLHTSYHDHYPDHQIHREFDGTGSGGKIKPFPNKSAPFYGDTAYKQHFTEKERQPVYKKEVPAVGGGLPFQGQSTYKDHYIPKQTVGSVQQAPISDSQRMKRGPRFEGESSYKTDYLPKSLTGDQKSSNQKPGYTYNPSKMQQAQSNYRQNYKGHQIARRQICAVEQLPRRPARLSPGKQHLVYDGQGSWQ